MHDKDKMRFLHQQVSILFPKMLMFITPGRGRVEARGVTNISIIGKRTSTRACMAGTKIPIRASDADVASGALVNNWEPLALHSCTQHYSD